MQHPPAFFHAGPLRQGAREPAQASLTLRPVGLLSRLKRPLSRGFSPSGYPAEPPVSYQINRQLEQIPIMLRHSRHGGGNLGFLRAHGTQE